MGSCIVTEWIKSVNVLAYKRQIPGPEEKVLLLKVWQFAAQFVPGDTCVCVEQWWGDDLQWETEDLERFLFVAADFLHDIARLCVRCPWQEACVTWN